MDKEKLKAMNLDEDVIEIVEYLNDNDFKTLASCDGVFAHHPNFPERFIGLGNILFEENDMILDLLAYAYEKGFDFMLSTKLSNKNPSLLYNELTYGDNYSIRFMNYNGENTQNIINMFHEFIDDKKRANIESINFIKEINDCIKKDDDKSDLYLMFDSGKYLRQSYMKDDEVLPTLTIGSKKDIDFKFDIISLGELIQDKFDIRFRSDPKEDNFTGDLFSVKVLSGTLCIYFDMKYYKKILELIDFLKENEFTFKKDLQ